MARITCSECGSQIPNDAFSCPDCGTPAQSVDGAQTEEEISSKGMTILLLLIVLFPVLLFLIHIFVPGM